MNITNGCIIGFIALIVSACGGGDSSSSSSSSSSSDSTNTVINTTHVVVSTTETIAEGITMSYTLEAGIYSAELTASNNGVTIHWVGGSGAGCAGASEVKSYNATCTLSIKGQMTVTNPTTFGFGPSEITTIKVTKLQ